MQLKDYFAREATQDIESVFLISKSACAFVNYGSEAACMAAVDRFHATRLLGMRIVCRRRRGVASDSSAELSPAKPDHEEASNRALTEVPSGSVAAEGTDDSPLAKYEAGAEAEAEAEVSDK